MAITDIKKLIGTDKLIIGSDRTIAMLKQGKIAAVYVSSNCPDSTITSIERYGVKVEKLDYPNDELGTICKKQFPISVLSVKNE